MKKKAIEKIPYLTLPKVSKKKDVKYIGVTALKNIDHERHLFLEVYRNSRDTRKVPLVRIVLTKKDFGNYFPEKAEWTRQKIENDHYYNYGLIWSDQDDYHAGVERTKKMNILFGEQDLQRIRTVCTEKIWDETRWWEYIYEHEDKIVTTARRQAEERKYARRQQALEDRIENTPELPEQRILDYAGQIYLKDHYLYYKKHGSYADVACSKCGGVSSGRWRAGMSYESQFERFIDEPREGTTGTCPLCKVRGWYKCQGRVKGFHMKKTHLFLGQKYKETGMVMRYIEVAKKWQLELIAGEKDVEMYGAYERLSVVEIARAYYMPDAKPQIDYHKYNPYTREDFWDDCNIGGLSSIAIGEAAVLPETYQNMPGTMFRYCAMQEYAKEVPYFNAIDYLDNYKATPQIEMLVKLGLTGVVKRLIEYQHDIVNDIDAKRPDLFLGIRKQRVRQLIEKKGDRDILEAMQMEYRKKAEWMDEQIEHIAEAGLSATGIDRALAFMSMQQLLNRIKKYAGCEWGSGCELAERTLRNTAITYLDYLNLRIDLGYDMNNTVYQQPRNLQEAHDEMVKESNKKQVEKRLLEVEMRFSGIAKHYRKLRKRYFYEDDQMLIRPARSAKEIVIEGRTLHHCVGGDNYLEKHNDDKSYILMLRQQSDPETPYITVEIDAKKDTIIQWYGANDKKPDAKNMQQWLDEYIARLKCGLLAAEQETCELLLAPAT